MCINAPSLALCSLMGQSLTGVAREIRPSVQCACTAKWETQQLELELETRTLSMPDIGSYKDIRLSSLGGMVDIRYSEDLAQILY